MNHPLPDQLTVWRSRAGVAGAVFGTVAAFLLIAERPAFVLPALSFLLRRACPPVHTCVGDWS